MNARILCLDIDPAIVDDAEAVDRHIDRMLCSLFSDGNEGNPLCGNYYCTGYWPAEMG